MTIQEALKVLEKEDMCHEIPLDSSECKRWHTRCYGCKYEVSTSDSIKAREMERKSLKAWRKVEVELSLQEQAHKDSKAIHTATGIRLAREIVKKYLGEVEE